MFRWPAKPLRGEFTVLGNALPLSVARCQSDERGGAPSLGRSVVPFKGSRTVLPDAVTFEQAGWFKSKDVNLESERIAVLLIEKTAAVRQIAAEGKVTITEEIREGKGEKAVYDLEQETVVLTGKPQVTDKQRGVIEGDKLTFRLGEGRIRVENKDRERSTTVIK